ncbi:ABC transporter ATP-binding protein [Elioraea sp.]|uniref:ABC transporter ATP-binding protein n=1 Tax=Elioraea sp. TaxID=2185103 RepID=UPI0021DF33DE|nr:ABC transporter ATP-binding protein [Elioraea sp.]GIX09240.1 MAG: ABC transporter [Elioraea sp.]
MIAAGELIVRLGGRAVLDGVSLAVAPGELVALVGPNGAGKSTLLRVLAGLLRPDAGRATLDGTPLAALAPRVRARRIAWLEQGARAAWGMTVREIARLGRLPHADSAEAPVAAALAAVGLDHMADRRIDRLSGGEARRAMIARVLATAPDVMLLDEPCADLDPAQGFAVMRLLRDAAAQGRAVVVILHDLALAARCADRMVLLDAGRVVADGPPGAVMADAVAGQVFGVRIGTGLAVLPA